MPLKDADLNKKKPNFIKVKENVRHTEKKLEAISKSLASARRNADKQQSVVDQLQAELSQMIAERDSYEETYRQESQSQGLQLSDTQVKPHKNGNIVSKILKFVFFYRFPSTIV